MCQILASRPFPSLSVGRSRQVDDVAATAAATSWDGRDLEGRRHGCLLPDAALEVQSTSMTRSSAARRTIARLTDDCDRRTRSSAQKAANLVLYLTVRSMPRAPRPASGCHPGEIVKVLVGRPTPDVPGGAADCRCWPRTNLAVGKERWHVKPLRTLPKVCSPGTRERHHPP